MCNVGPGICVAVFSFLYCHIFIWLFCFYPKFLNLFFVVFFTRLLYRSPNWLPPILSLSYWPTTHPRLRNDRTRTDQRHHQERKALDLRHRDGGRPSDLRPLRRRQRRQLQEGDAPRQRTGMHSLSCPSPAPWHLFLRLLIPRAYRDVARSWTRASTTSSRSFSIRESSVPARTTSSWTRSPSSRTPSVRPSPPDPSSSLHSRAWNLLQCSQPEIFCFRLSSLCQSLPADVRGPQPAGQELRYVPSPSPQP